MRLTRLLLLVAVVPASTGALLVVPVVLGQEKAPRTPNAFKVYSRDGRESLTASCRPIRLGADQVICNFVHVRVQPPEGKTLPPGTIPLAEALLTEPSAAERVRQEFCTPDSKERAAIETRIRDPGLGPKREAYYRQLLAACSLKDPTVFVMQLFDLERRACGLWVDQFTLEFKKIRAGQWLHQTQAPGLLSKVLKVYELTGDGLQWILSETRVPTEGADEKPAQTVWSWKNVSEYELSCDFISHGLIQFPPFPH